MVLFQHIVGRTKGLPATMTQTYDRLRHRLTAEGEPSGAASSAATFRLPPSASASGRFDAGDEEGHVVLCVAGGKGVDAVYDVLD